MRGWKKTSEQDSHRHVGGYVANDRIEGGLLNRIRGGHPNDALNAHGPDHYYKTAS